MLKLIYRHRNVDALRTYCAALLQSVCSLGWFIYFGWFCLLSICEFCVSEAAVDFTITDRHSTTECSPAADDASLKCLLAFKKTTLTHISHIVLSAAQSFTLAFYSLFSDKHLWDRWAGEGWWCCFSTITQNFVCVFLHQKFLRSLDLSWSWAIRVSALVQTLKVEPQQLMSRRLMCFDVFSSQRPWSTRRRLQPRSDIVRDETWHTLTNTHTLILRILEWK